MHTYRVAKKFSHYSMRSTLDACAKSHHSFEAAEPSVAKELGVTKSCKAFHGGFDSNVKQERVSLDK